MSQPVNIHIPEPCHENWADMKPREQGRFCASCSKTVIDFSSMSDRQLFEFFKDYSGKACGRFSNDQLNRDITVAPQRRTGWLRYVMAIMVPAMLLSNRSFSQGRVKAKKVCLPAKPPQLMGDTIITNVEVKPPVVKQEQEEEITVTLGGLVSVTRVERRPIFHQFKKFIADSVKKTPFNIFPNPAAPGAVLRTNFKGQYFIQVIDNNGLLVQEEKLPDGTIHLSKNILPGLYTVLLTNGKRKKIGSQKLIVQ